MRDDLIFFIQNHAIEEAIDKLKEKPKIVGKIWMNTAQEIQEEKILDVIDKVKKNPYSVREIWMNTAQEIQKEKILDVIDKVKGNLDCVRKVWMCTASEVQKENFELLDDIIDKVKENSYSVREVWMNTAQEIQEEKILGLIDKVKKNSYTVREVWMSTAQEVQKEKIIDVIDKVKEKIDCVREVWINTAQEVQKKKSGLLNDIIDKVKKNPYTVREVWVNTAQEIKEEKIIDVIDKVKENPDCVGQVWKSTNSVLRLKNFSEVFEKIQSSNNSEYYESFAKNYLGAEIEFNKNGTPSIPVDLKKILSNINDSNQAENIEKNLVGIIKNWNEIKQYIQLKRANSIVNDGIEIRRNSINEILNAVKAINRPIANTISAQEFEQIKGAEKVGVDNQYTVSPSTAVQRAHILAEVIDSASCKKAYPNFSVKNKEGTIELNVLHPQDKSAILLGHDTHCCFRPNGHADNDAKNEYSLLQYCTTTPYGGILRCESSDKKEIYMGTPFLVNGNCMMLHSYETANGKKADEINEVLVEAAKSAIENSEGSIDIVFMTDLHIGNGRLKTKDKIIIQSYFKPYTKDEYSKYSIMYNNFDRLNCILAARVGDKVLSGNDLLNWYENECDLQPRKLIRKLNLYMGAREKRFDFGRREIEETIEIPEYELVEKFYKKKRKLEQLRENLALVLQIKKLESKSELSKSEQDELSFLKSKIEGKIDINKIGKISIDAIRNEIKQNREKQLALYSGEDIDLIADIYGIDIEKEARKRVEKKLENKKIKDKKDIKKGNVISKLIAIIRESNDERVKSIEKLNEKILKNQISDGELEILSQAGIDVTQYIIAFRKNEEQNINSKNNEQNNIEGQVRKIMKDKAQKETIFSELFWKDEDISECAIRKDKLEKLKARITLGLETKSKIQSIKDRIDGKKSSNDDIAQLKYGLSWYIALDSEGNVLYSHRNEEMDKDGVEKDKYEKILNELLEKNQKSMPKGLKKESIKEAIGKISTKDKQKAITKVSEVSKVDR